ncbi:MAG: hypothetical protein JEY99_08445 [Spirochaetales bacterium]|nr:hypothetical protein [Spirochaetales bacterium]
MWSDKRVDLTGYHGRKIYNKHYVQPEKSSRCTLIISGFAYTMESPFLYYSKMAAFNSGSDVLMVDFEYNRNIDFLDVGDSEKDLWFETEIDSLFEWLLGSGYSGFTLIGKSLGTTVMFKLLERLESGYSRNCEVDSIKGVGSVPKISHLVWLTPGTFSREIYAYLAMTETPSFLVYGSKDDYSPQVLVETVKNNKVVDIYQVEGANHALETGAMDKDIQNLGDYTVRLEKFIK